MGEISFQLNNPEAFTLTTAQLSTIHALTIFAEAEAGNEVTCDIVEADNPSAPHVKFIVNYPDAQVVPTRYWIDPDGSIGLQEDMTWVGEDER